MARAIATTASERQVEWATDGHEMGNDCIPIALSGDEIFMILSAIAPHLADRRYAKIFADLSDLLITGSNAVEHDHPRALHS